MISWKKKILKIGSLYKIDCTSFVFDTIHHFEDEFVFMVLDFDQEYVKLYIPKYNKICNFANTWPSFSVAKEI